MKQKAYYLMMLCALTMMGCSDDDNGMYFTKDEVVEGDILTGKQTGIKENTVDVYTTEQTSVNVQGASGNISAVSENESIAKVITCDNSGTKKVFLMGVAEGKTGIVVTDELGNTARFVANVVDVKKAWKTSAIYELDEKKCVVEGVSKADSAEIASSVLANDKKHLMYILFRTYYPTEMLRIIIKDKEDHSLLEGILHRSDDGQNVSCWVIPYGSYEAVVLDQFCQMQDKETKQPYFVWDLTSSYQGKYPTVTSVKLYIHGTPIYSYFMRE